MEKTRFLFSTAVLVVHYLMMTCTAKTETNITIDQYALLAMKANIPSDSRGFLAKNWSAETSVCNWIGVTCGVRHQRVRALNISTMALHGTIPPHLGNLSFLVSLDLSGNSFSGHLPNELVNLRRLKLMNLNSNHLSGGIPSWLIALSRLDQLLLANNKFTGSIPPTIFIISSLRIIDFSHNDLSGNLDHVDVCNHLPKLEELRLQYNKLNGQIPSSLHNCSKLQILDLDYNRFNGPIPREICNLTMLKRLLLGGNYLQGGIPKELGNLKLEELVLQFNYLTGPIPPVIFNMSTLRARLGLVGNQLSGNLPANIGHSLPNLEGLFLGGNNLSGILPHTISNASNLIKLELSENMFTGSIPHSLGNLARLKYLGLYQNNFISESSSPELSFLTSLTNCPHLTELQIADNPLNGILPVSIGNLSTSFETFNAGYCGIEGNIPNEIGNLSNLASLYLTGNHLIGLIPTSIKGLRKLQRLYLDYNGIEGSIPKVFCQLFYMGLLSLSENKLFGLIPTCLGNVSSLRYIYLGSNRLTSPIPATLWNLEYLLELNISSNTLGGYLPPKIGSLKVATKIDLSMNQFTGNIPSTIASLQDLTSLSLANNRLQGPIPDIFQSMVGLEFLDLSRNNLSGVIPPSLETLLHLKYFNISFNRLRGEIPTRGPFANFTNQSFMSNEALCGAPQFQVLPCDTSSLHKSRIKRVLLVVYIMLPIASILLVLTVAFVCLRCRNKNKAPIQTGSIFATERERFSYHELLQATDGFRESNLLGIGSIGLVYKGTLIDGTIFAVKVFNPQLQGSFKSFDTECEILRNIRHRNLTKVISSYSNLDFKALILQYMPNGNLEKWLYSHDHNYFLDISQRLDVMIDVACAIYYLHNGYSTTIVHCDLKPSNVLIDEDMVAHVSDFGIGRFLGDGESTTLTKTLATFGYIAPEYGMEGLVSTRCDVYSYGIMLMETFTRRKPTDDLFSGDLSLRGWVKESLPNAVIRVIDSNLVRPKEEDVVAKVQCVSSVMELALNCSAESPRERINMGDVLAALEKIRLRFLANHVQKKHERVIEMQSVVAPLLHDARTSV